MKAWQERGRGLRVVGVALHGLTSWRSFSVFFLQTPMMKLLLLLWLLSAVTRSSRRGGELRGVGGEGEERHQSTAPSPGLTFHQYLHPYLRLVDLAVPKGNESTADASWETHTTERRGIGRRGEEGRDVKEGALSTQYTKTYEKGQNSSLPRLKKKRDKKRKAYSRWQRRRQHRGGRTAAAKVRVVVDGGAVTAPLPHFWRSTGLR